MVSLLIFIYACVCVYKYMWVSLLPAGQSARHCPFPTVMFSNFLLISSLSAPNAVFMLYSSCLFELFLLFIVVIPFCIRLRCTFSTSLHLLFRDFLYYWQTLLCCQLPRSLPCQLSTEVPSSVEVPYYCITKLHKKKQKQNRICNLPSHIFRFKCMLTAILYFVNKYV